MNSSLVFNVSCRKQLFKICKPWQVTNNGWAEGECKGKAGWFPFGYIERRDRVLASKMAEVFWHFSCIHFLVQQVLYVYVLLTSCDKYENTAFDCLFFFFDLPYSEISSLCQLTDVRKPFIYYLFLYLGVLFILVDWGWNSLLFRIFSVFLFVVSRYSFTEIRSCLLNMTLLPLLKNYDYN